MADSWQLKAVLSANSESMVKALGDVGKMAKSARKYLGDVASSAGKVGAGLGLPVAALSGVLGGFSLMAVKNAVVGFTELGEAVQNGALKAGMSVQEYQRMKYVADQSGTSIEAMEGSLSKLNRQVGDAAAGKNKDLSLLMKKLGVDMRDANGQVRAGIDMLPQLADAFQRNENPATRARMGMALFGKSYADILPLLADGSKGIEDNLSRFDKIKGVLGPEEIRGAKDLGDSFKDLELVMKGFQGTIAKELTPVIQPLITELTQWWMANKKVVGVEVAKVAKDLGKWIKTIDFSQLLTDIGSFIKGIGKFIEMIGGAKNALIGLVLYMNIQTIMAIGGLIGSMWRLGSAFLGFSVGVIPKALISLGLYTPATTAAAAATTELAVASDAAAVSAGGWLTKLSAVLGVLGSIAVAAAPLAAIWGVSEWASDTSHDQERVDGIKSNMAEPAKGMLSWFGFDKDADIEKRRAANRAGLDSSDELAQRPSLISPLANVKASGQIEVSFKDAPPGMRVDQAKVGGNVPINTSVGYRSDALGMP